VGGREEFSSSFCTNATGIEAERAKKLPSNMGAQRRNCPCWKVNDIHFLYGKCPRRKEEANQKGFKN